MKDKGLLLSDYKQMTHRIGRIWTAAAMLLICAVPLFFCIIYGVLPEWNSFYTGAVAIIPMFWAVGLIEVFNYSPMLGVGGTYLAFVTGNLANMKVPAAKVALSKAGVDATTEEGEVLATIAVAVSTIVTDLVLIAGLLLVIPITGWINSDPVLSSVFDLSTGYVIPALFGAIGVVFLSKSWKIAIVPTLLMILIFLLIPAIYTSYSIFIPVMSIFAVLIARLMYKKNMI